MSRHRWYRAAPVLALLALTACPKDGPSDSDFDDLEITTSTLADAVVGEAYSVGVDADGGDGEYEWDLASGELPPGLDLSVDDITDDDLLITGLPEEEGEFDFVLRVHSDDGQTDTRAFSIEVLGEPPPLSITTPVLPPALAGASYRTPLVAQGGDGQFTWTVVGGTLPNGLSIKDGANVDSIVGTPTDADTAIVVLRVESDGFEDEAAFTLQVVANRTGTFDITVAPVVPVPAALQAPLAAALARWQGVIVGDLSSAAIPGGFFGSTSCGGFGSILNGTAADDMIILVNIAPIDGPGDVLGQATPCVIRGSNNLPFAGVLTLDSEDLTLASLPAQWVTDLIMHEIGHVLGFGSLWEEVDLIVGDADPRFTGALAVDAWQDLGGSGNVPVENQGGGGTARAHWRESVFDREVMTGFAENPATVPGNPQPLSAVTIASLEDLGYDTNPGEADPFILPAPPAVAQRAPEAESYGYDVVPRIDIYRIDDAGRRTIYRRGTE